MLHNVDPTFERRLQNINSEQVMAIVNTRRRNVTTRVLSAGTIPRKQREYEQQHNEQ